MFLSVGQWGACSSASFPGNRWANLTSIPPITGNLPFPRSKDCSHVLPAIRSTRWDVAPGPCFRHVRSPHPLNHWCLCLRLWALSSVLKLGKHRAYRPAGCSPTGSFYYMHFNKHLFVHSANVCCACHSWRHLEFSSEQNRLGPCPWVSEGGWRWRVSKISKAGL